MKHFINTFIFLIAHSSLSQNLIEKNLNDGLKHYYLTSDTAFFNHMPQIDDHIHGNVIPFNDKKNKDMLISSTDSIFAKHIKRRIVDKYYITVYLSGSGRIIAVKFITSNTAFKDNFIPFMKEVENKVKTSINELYKSNAYVGNITFPLLMDFGN